MAEMWAKKVFLAYPVSGLLTNLALTDVNIFHSLIISNSMLSFQLGITYVTLRYVTFCMFQKMTEFFVASIYVLPITFHTSSWMDIGTLTNPKFYFCGNCNFPVKSHILGHIYVTNEIK